MNVGLYSCGFSVSLTKRTTTGANIKIRERKYMTSDEVKVHMCTKTSIQTHKFTLKITNTVHLTGCRARLLTMTTEKQVSLVLH